MEEKQIYYRYFHEDTFVHLTSISFKDTEIYKKTHLNYFSIPGSLLSGSGRILKLYIDFLIVTTIPHAKYREFTEPLIILPIIYSSVQI